MRSVCFLSVLIVIPWFKVCQSDETTLGSDIDSLSPHKVQPKVFVILLPPVFSIIGVTLIAVSILTTIFCIAYCVFLPWAHALSSKTAVREVTTPPPSIASAASGPNPVPYVGAAAALPPHPYYAGGGGPYFPNQPYPYYAGPPPPTGPPPPNTECSTETAPTTTSGTTTTTKPAPTTSPTPDEQHIKETEEYIWD